MNLLHVISSMNPQTGGPCQGIINLHGGLTSLGVYQEVVSLDDPEAAYIRQSSLVIHSLGMPRGSWQYSTQFSPWLQANIDRFDVVVLHGLWLYLGYAIWKELAVIHKKREKNNDEKKSPKFFIIPHGMLDPWFQRNAQRRFKAIRNVIYWHLIERKIINSADGLLFTCETELLLAKEPFLRYTPQREVNIGYGVVEPPRYSEAIHNTFYNRFPQLKNEQYLLFLGRIHPKKGVDLLIQAYERILTSPEFRLSKIPKLIIAGPGLETPYGKIIQRLVAKSSALTANVLFTGMIMDELKWGAFYNAEAFILPSHQENFGIAVVEALACKKAVLISDQVNIWREINENNAGLVFNNSIEETKLAIIKFLNMNKEDKNSLSQSAYKTFKNLFSVDLVAKRFAETVSI